MGGQDCKAINCNTEGHVINFVMNDKCAGGTGRFLEMIADVLGVPLEEIGELALQSSNEIPFNTICAVFAKSEAMVHRRHGVANKDILAGLNDAISLRCLNLLKKISIEKDFTITGGIAKNAGMVGKINQKVGLKPMLAKDPQLIGALGAAIFAREKYLGNENRDEAKIHYGYNDATGDYFITIDAEKCNGCGECVYACPSDIFEIVNENDRHPKVTVKETARKKLSILCPGHDLCKGKNQSNCQNVCPKNAIRLSW
jgi:ferredoxin